jgi:serine/threonine protein kinase
MMNRVGQFLGNYRLIEPLGKGGYAEVYKGEHIHLGTYAAIKVLKTINTADEIMRFRAEARIIASLEHPNIIRVRDFDISEEGTPFLVMDYARKGSLQDLLPRGRALPYVTVVSYIKQIATALQYAHDQNNLIHCDIKPANMLMLNHNKIVLSDFGVAQIAQSGRQDAVGTVYYMAPEQIQGHPVLASDQYALGIVAYEWLSGDRPFQGTPQEIRYQHLHKYPPGLNGRVPAKIEQVILRALAKDPNERFSSVKEFADALENEYQRAAQDAQNSTSPISSVRPNTSVSPADSDSTTVFFSGPTVQPMASAGALIAHYDGLLKEFHQLNSDHTRALQELKQYSDQEIANIEAALQQDQKEVNQRIELVREAVRTTKNTLQNSPWSNVVAKTTVSLIQTPGSLEQMKASQTKVLDASSKIKSSKSRFMGRNYYYRLSMLSIGFVSTFIAVLYAIYAFIVWAIRVFGVQGRFFSGATIIGYLIFVLVLLLVVGAFWLRDYLVTTQAITTEYVSLLQASSSVEVTSTKQNEALQNTRRTRLANHQARYAQAYQQRERKLQESLNRFTPILTRYIQEDGLQVAGWDDPQWLRWQPPRLAIPLARLGVIINSARFPSLPALVICPGGDNLLFKTPGAAKEKAVQALQSLMLRLLTSQSPGKLRFTLIDPTGLGQNVATFFQLTEYDRQLISGKAWSKREQISQQLTELSDHMGNVIQQYLRNQYDTIDDYNRVAGEIAEPYRILVVVGFPNNFSKETANQLTNIATAGPRCGVYVMMTVDTEQSLPQGFKLAELERVAKVIDYDGQNFTWQHKDIGTCKLQLDELPRQAVFGQLLKRIGEEAFEAQQRVEIPFRWVIERGIIPEYRWWASDQNTIEEIVTPLGRMGATNSQYLRLGKGTAHHVLIVGQTGSGKTNLLHDLIVGLSLIYTPDELELYLIDFKTVGFTPYAQHKLPHARVIAIQSEREYGLSVLEGLEEELEQRKQLFSRAGTQDFTQFRKSRPNQRMPRILLIIDEFQELFMQRDEIAKQAAEHLNRFVRTGRGLGIHVILASQTLAGLSSLGRSTILDNSTITQMTVRVAMKNEKADSHLILSDDNSSSGLLFQFRPGEAIYNADSGAEEGNKRFQSFWLSNEELSVYLDAIRQLAQQYNYVTDPARGQKIFDGSKNADVSENQALNALLRQPGWPAQQFPTIWLGDPISLKDTTNIQMRPR